jgi:hypothetical protein
VFYIATIFIRLADMPGVPSNWGATFIANAATAEVEAEHMKLYRQDPDWNTPLPELSETTISGEVESLVCAGFGNFRPRYR